MFNKTLLGIGAGIAIAVGVAIGLHHNRQANIKTVFFEVPNGFSIAVYNDLGGDGAYNYDAKKAPVAQLSHSGRIRLERGTYVWAATPKEKLQKTAERFTVADNSTVNVHLIYNDATLSTALPAVRPAIIAMLQKKYPKFSESYVIYRDQLFGVGNWYGAYLKSTRADFDDLRVVMRRGSGGWRVATDPPHITVGSPSNPDIPIDIIRSVNSMGN